MRDPYPATFQRRHHNVISPVPPFYTRNNNLSNVAMDGYCINPNVVTTFLAMLNGWDDRKENIPSFVNNAMYILITVWVFPNTDDRLGSERTQVVFGGKKFAFRTFSPSTKKWSEWIENT